MRVKIEKLKKRDLPAFYSLFKRAIFEDFKEFTPEVARFQWKRYCKRNLLRWIKQGEEYVFLAKDKEGGVAGILASGKVIGGVSTCDWLIVSKGYRQQGIGTRLLKFWENWVKRNKGHMLSVYADKRLVKYYEKFGFKIFGFMKGGYFGENDYLLSKKIGKWNKRSLDAGTA